MGWEGGAVCRPHVMEAQGSSISSGASIKGVVRGLGKVEPQWVPTSQAITGRVWPGTGVSTEAPSNTWSGPAERVVGCECPGPCCSIEGGADSSGGAALAQAGKAIAGS